MKYAFMLLSVVFIWSPLSHSETPQSSAITRSDFDLAKAKGVVTELDRVRAAVANPQNPNDCKCRAQRLSDSEFADKKLPNFRAPQTTTTTTTSMDLIRRNTYGRTQRDMDDYSLYAINEDEEFAATAGRLDESHKMVGGAFRVVHHRTSSTVTGAGVEARIFGGFGSTTLAPSTPLAQSKKNSLLGLNLKYKFK